jgi:hypothetical protein
MSEINIQDRQILSFLTKNPRISDSAISKATKIPIKTVSRHRKKLASSIVQTYTAIDFIKAGVFTGRSVFIIELAPGIAQMDFLSTFGTGFSKASTKHISELFIGKRDGGLSLHLTLESYKFTDLFEILNADILSELKAAFGDSCIQKVTAYNDIVPIIRHTNYAVREKITSKSISFNPFVGD